ncbi:MMPL family transporter [Actinoplanes aureus]|uniref:MMPL family transporter n=1 Tax=Actinoplanes aureus TaxID=2792083 RepID=A0A931C9Q0_9ACTN|nr:MMPL family transporter [Actinoplanes aureus]MBG0566049.1 MMPL family transporter [Actinoplanes aureus]
MPKSPVTVRVARWSALHPWRAMLLWVVFVVLCFTAGAVTGTREASDGAQNLGESSRAEAIVRSGDFATPVATENVLITARSGPLDRDTATRAAAAVTKRMQALPDVGTADDPVPAPKGDALLVRVTIEGDPMTSLQRLAPLLAATAAVQQEYPSLRVEQVGSDSIDKAVNEILREDFVRAELFSIPVTLAILLVTFGALIAAGVPVLLALSAVAAAIGLSGVASHLVPANGMVNSVILLLGLAVGVDYSLFYLRREREERARGRGHVDAVEIAAATSGHAVVVSGIAVTVSMAGLFLAGDPIFSSLAVGAILVVAIAVAGSLTVLPAVLAKLGRWVDRPRVPVLWRLASRTGTPRFWPAVLRPVLKHPAAALTVSLVALLALAAPALGMKLKNPGEADLPRTAPVMQAYDRLTAAYPSTGTTHLVAVEAPAASAPAVAEALDDLVSRTRTDGLFSQDGLTEPEVSADRTVTTLAVATPYAGDSADARRSLDKLRTQLLPATVGAVPGAEYAVGGTVAADGDYSRHLRERLPLVIGFVLLLTFVVMVATFRAIVVALKAILLNLLSAGSAYGLLVWVFQYDNPWAENLLGFRSNHAVVAWLPLLLFVILFGLSMDYHIFVVSRIREAVLRGVPSRQAVADGITGSAGVVTSAAIVMVAVFSIFATLSTVDMKQLGVGLAAAILIDATLIRAVVLPSLMILLGSANWWTPAFLRRRGEPTPAPHHQPQPTPVG